MKNGLNWHPLSFVWAGLLILIVLSALCGTGHVAEIYASTERAIPIEPPPGQLRQPQVARSDELTAMEWTAWAAVVSTFLGFATLITLIATLIVTGLTLKQAQETTRAAWETADINREVGQNQSKAYTWVERVEVCFPRLPDKLHELMTAGPSTPKVRVVLHLRNDGSTPALQISATAHLQVKSSSANAFAPMKLEYERSTEIPFRERVLAKASSRKLALAIPYFVLDRENAFAAAVQDDEILWRSYSYEIKGHIEYSDVYGHLYHSSFKCFGSVQDDARYYDALMTDLSEALFQRVGTRQKSTRAVAD